MGILNTKVHKTLLIIEKKDLPHPLKNPLVQKTTGTRIYSKQKLFAYKAPAFMVSSAPMEFVSMKKPMICSGTLKNRIMTIIPKIIVPAMPSFKVYKARSGLCAPMF